jgi:AraC-like DNA-binding protein
MDRLSQELVLHQALDVIALSLAGTIASEAPRLSSGRAVTLLRVQAAIDARLSDSELDPVAVAAAAGVSVRYANAALARQGTSIAKLIQTKRLDRCRRALEDPAQRQRSVSEIAYGWGFSDMTHFGRRFKAAFGMSPRDHRKLKN